MHRPTKLHAKDVQVGMVNIWSMKNADSSLNTGWFYSAKMESNITIGIYLKFEW